MYNCYRNRSYLKQVVISYLVDIEYRTRSVTNYLIR